MDALQELQVGVVRRIRVRGICWRCSSGHTRDRIGFLSVADAASGALLFQLVLVPVRALFLHFLQGEAAPDW